jgi:hypothetical protein
VPGPFVQTEAEMLAVTEETYRSVNRFMTGCSTM